MKILFNISHPAHVHLFKNAIKESKSAGHDIRVLSRKREITTDLLNAYNIEHTPISKRGSSTASLISEMGIRELRAIKYSLAFRPDLVISRLDMTAIHAAKLTGAECIVFHDTEVAGKIAKINLPFIDQIHTPRELSIDLGEKHKRYNSYQELAYLHPDRYTPNKSNLISEGIPVDDDYFVMRFVGWDAHHDRNQSGLSPQMKREMIEYLDSKGEVYITSEADLPSELELYRIDLSPHLVHDLMSFADLYIGDSQAMAAEAAILGTPAIRSNSFCGDNDMSKFVELEKEYNLMYSFADEKRAFEKIKSLCNNPTEQDSWENRKSQMLRDKIDLTEYILNVINEQHSCEADR